MLSGICEHIDKAVMAPTTWMPCITHRIYAIDFQLISLHANETHVHLLDRGAFVFDLQHHRIGLSWIERSFKEHFSAVTLSIYCMIISECVCESVLAACAVSVVFEQRIHAAKIRGHPWHLTPINQTSAEFYSLSVSLFLFLPPSLPPVLFRWLAVFTWWSSLALGTGGRGIREMKLGEKRKTDSDLG